MSTYLQRKTHRNYLNPVSKNSLKARKVWYDTFQALKKNEARQDNMPTIIVLQNQWRNKDLTR
jgi:hypothetical protein